MCLFVVVPSEKIVVGFVVPAKSAIDQESAPLPFNFFHNNLAQNVPPFLDHTGHFKL